MKQNNRDCKIVQDLLPNYIENLTDEVTNEYIEEHIATCAECAQMLKDMNGELKLEQINQDHEIKYLDGLRKKVRRTIIAVAIAIILIAGCVVGYVYKKSKIQITNYTFLTANCIRRNQQGTKDGNLYITLIAVIDENGKCKSSRIIYKGYDGKEISYKIEEYYDSNLQVIGDEIHCNINIWNGYEKEELKSYWKEEYLVEEIKEI